MRTTILYLPGLGDRYDSFRRWALGLWSFSGIDAELVPLTWYDGNDFDSKMTRIDAAVERASRTNNRIVVIGESAGASMALHVAARHTHVNRVITLCGVTRRSTPIAASLRRRAPSLDKAVRTLPGELTTPIDSIRAVVDGVVGRRYSVASNSREHMLWTIGHLTTIVLCLTLLAPYVVRLSRRDA